MSLHRSRVMLLALVLLIQSCSGAPLQTVGTWPSSLPQCVRHDQVSFYASPTDAIDVELNRLNTDPQCVYQYFCPGGWQQVEFVAFPDDHPASVMWNGHANDHVSIQEQNTILTVAHSHGALHRPPGKYLYRIVFERSLGVRNGAPPAQIYARVYYAKCPSMPHLQYADPGVVHAGDSRDQQKK